MDTGGRELILSIALGEVDLEEGVFELWTAETEMKRRKRVSSTFLCWGGEPVTRLNDTYEDCSHKGSHERWRGPRTSAVEGGAEAQVR